MALKPSRTPPADAPVLDVLPGRKADIGMPVVRMLPTAGRRSVGPWVFADHFGPTALAKDGGVAPHPHCGLSTVTWLLDGEGLHKDSLGTTQRLRPGELNWMTAGRGITHSEEMPAGRVHGLQLWVALPPEQWDCEPAFEHRDDLPRVTTEGGIATVLAGSIAVQGAQTTSPTTVHSPTVAIDLALTGPVTLEVDPAHEHGLIVAEGAVRIDDTVLEPGQLAYLGTQRQELQIEPVDGSARAMLIGGEPLRAPVLMWWNFVVPSWDALVDATRDWDAAAERFGDVPHYTRGPRLDAPSLPGD